MLRLFAVVIGFSLLCVACGSEPDAPGGDPDAGATEQPPDAGVQCEPFEPSDGFAAASYNPPIEQVVFANGMFVGGGPDGILATSDDGVDWTIRYTLEYRENRGFGTGDDSLRGIRRLVYDGDRFIANTSHVVVTSVNGIEWTESVIEFDHGIRGPMAYFDGTYVAPTNGGVAVSQDGVQWERVRFFSSRAPQLVVHANGVFAVLAGFADGDFLEVFTSPDGMKWTEVGQLDVQVPRMITTATGPILFAWTLGDAPRAIALSTTDFVEWTELGEPNLDVGGHIGRTANEFVVMGESESGGGYVARSTDGIVWSEPALTEREVTSVAFGADTWVAVGPRGIYTAEQPTSFSTVRRHGLHVNAIAGHAGRLVAVGGTHGPLQAPDVNGEALTMVSDDDGASWSTTTAEIPHGLHAVAYGNDRYVAVGDRGALATSSDGTTWTREPSVGTQRLERIAYGAETFVALTGGVFAHTSADGTTWTPALAIGNVRMRDLTYGRAGFVAVGADQLGLARKQAVATSPDGVEWTVQLFDPGSFRRVAYSAGMYVAVGEGGAVRRSTDGVTWTEVPSLPDENLQTIGGGPAGFVTASPEAVYFSADGESWIAHAIENGVPFYGALLSDSTALIVGNSEKILRATGTTVCN